MGPELSSLIIYRPEMNSTAQLKMIDFVSCWFENCQNVGHHTVENKRARLGNRANG